MRIDWRESPKSPDTLRHRHDRVLLDGEDVTSGCFLADDVEGVVGNYLKDASGHFYRSANGVAQQIRKGVVTILPQEKS